MVIIQLLENILYLVSDRNPDVSEAAKDATRAVMKKLSAHGVKLVMGPLLNAFAAPKWQSKVASISMLGYMAYCAPKQLASCLPIIMPKLALALADAHPKVRRAGLAALDDVVSKAKPPANAPHKQGYIKVTGAELWKSLRARLQDSNKNILVQVLALLGKIAEAMGPDADKHAKHVLPSMLVSFVLLPRR